MKPDIKWVGSPNFGYPRGTKGRQGQRTYAIVHHICQGTLEGTDSWFRFPGSGASSQYVVGAAGQIRQYVELTDAAWTNGLMNRPDMSIPWLRECMENNINPNLRTVSIEYEGMHVTDPATGKIINPNWQPTEAQYQAGLALTRWLCQELNLIPDRTTQLGHFQIDAVNRPYCPGPLFPFSRLLADLQAPTWSLPTCRVVMTDGTELWGRLENGRALVVLPGMTEECWIRPVATVMGRKPRFVNQPPTVYIE